SAPLTDALQLLRATPTVRAEWRTGVLDEVARSGKRARRVTLSIPWAITAGLACAVAGDGAALLATNARSVVSPTVAQVPIAIDSHTSMTMLPVHFSVVAPRAAHVSIVGDFNHWNPTTLPMRRSVDGRTWE